MNFFRINKGSYLNLDNVNRLFFSDGIVFVEFSNGKQCHYDIDYSYFEICTYEEQLKD